MSINFEDTLNTIDIKIQESIQIHLDSLKTSLLSEAKDIFINDFTKKIHGNNELFTTDYNKDFLDKYTKFITSIPYGNSKKLIELNANIIKSYICPTEYVVFIKPIFGKDIGQRYNKQMITQCNYIIVTNMLNIHTIINNNNLIHTNNLLLNDLQIDLFNKLCYNDIYKYFNENRFINKYEAVKKDYEDLEKKYNLNLNILKANNVEQKIIDTIKDNVNANRFHYLKNQKYEELYNIVIQMKNHNWHRVSEHYRYFESRVKIANKTKQELENVNNKEKQYQKYIDDINNGTASSHNPNQFTSYKHVLSQIPKQKISIICQLNNNIEIKDGFEPTIDIINHLVYMFKTFWNGKTLSPYSKELKAENEMLKEREDEIELRSQKLERLENEQYKKINITKLILTNSKFKKELDDKHTKIKADILKNQELIKQLEYLKEKDDYLVKLEERLQKKDGDLDIKKIKLAQYKKSLDLKTKLLKQEKIEFELEKQNLLNMDFELSDGETEDLHIGISQITGRIKKGHGYKDHETIVNTNNNYTPKKNFVRRRKSCN